MIGYLLLSDLCVLSVFQSVISQINKHNTIIIIYIIYIYYRGTISLICNMSYYALLFTDPNVTEANANVT